MDPWTHVPGREPRELSGRETQARAEGSTLGQKGVSETDSASREGLVARGRDHVLQPPAVGPAGAWGCLCPLRGQVAQSAWGGPGAGMILGGGQCRVMWPHQNGEVQEE